MTEDLVEFGATAPRTKRAPRRNRPQWLNNSMLPVAALGALAGAGSLMLPWQKILFRGDEGLQPGPTEDPYQAMLISLGSYGSGYLLTLIATVTVVALLFYGRQVAQGALRVIGATLSGVNVVILAMTAYALSNGSAVTVGFVVFRQSDRAQMTIHLDSGFYAALAAVAALAVVALRAQPLAGTEDDEPGSVGGGAARDDDLDAGADDGVIDLSVSVHPVGKQVAAG